MGGGGITGKTPYPLEKGLPGRTDVIWVTNPGGHPIKKNTPSTPGPSEMEFTLRTPHGSPTRSQRNSVSSIVVPPNDNVKK